MFRYIAENKGVIILSAVVLASFLWMTSQVREPGGGPSLLERGVNAAVYPFIKAIDTVTGGARSVWDGYFYLVGLVSENEQLNDEKGRLTLENAALRERLARYGRIEALLELKERSEFPSVPAEVIGRDPTTWFKTVWVDAGTDDGVEKNMPATVYSGLVGRVMKPYPGSSRIMLITHPGSSVSCIVERSRETGILTGDGSGICQLELVAKKADVSPGDLVVTSGLDRVFPKGMPVGVVGDVLQDAPGYFQQITVTPTADLDHIEDLMIITYRPEAKQ